MKIFYLLLLLSFNSFATTCISNSKAFEKLSKEHGSKIDVQIKNSTNGHDVLVWLPPTIENKALSFVLFHLGNKENPEFSSQLAIFDERGKKAVYFTTNREQLPNGYIIAGYGGDCGIQIGKTVSLATQT
ncbi:hypothetical protein [Shewanella sp. WPAGA9]|uniref:hypothetical protein n=1 Tax=Shewanella sp. ENK2 TaxID=2775245 RepID=UPI0017825862|nr:hypothetical protein [Shewanella sp. WPAGA9]